jgi:hypothetical protein
MGWDIDSDLDFDLSPDWQFVVALKWTPSSTALLIAVADAAIAGCREWARGGCKAA